MSSEPEFQAEVRTALKSLGEKVDSVVEEQKLTRSEMGAWRNICTERHLDIERRLPRNGRPPSPGAPDPQADVAPYPSRGRQAVTITLGAGLVAGVIEAIKQVVEWISTRHP